MEKTIGKIGILGIKMLCFVYKSLKTEYLYLYVDKADDFSAVPAALLATLGRLALVMEMELTPERQLARESAEKIIASIEEKGFFVQLPPVKESALKS